jgi:hypothetical protein
MEKVLLVSGDTGQMEGWDIDKTLKNQPTNRELRDRLSDYEWENKLARNGMTYLEILQFNNTFNQ